MREQIFALAVGAVLLGACSSSPPPNTINGCGDGDFVDRTAGGASRVINFGGQGGSGSFSYDPNCMLISVGQTASFQGDLLSHPLRPGIGPGQGGTGSPNNPILPVSAGSSTDVTFPTAGTYPYFCNIHGVDGMVGAVKVQ